MVRVIKCFLGNPLNPVVLLFYPDVSFSEICSIFISVLSNQHMYLLLLMYILLNIFLCGMMILMQPIISLFWHIYISINLRWIIKWYVFDYFCSYRTNTCLQGHSLEDICWILKKHIKISVCLSILVYYIIHLCRILWWYNRQKDIPLSTSIKFASVHVLSEYFYELIRYFFMCFY